ncbi:MULTISPECIES: diacylglycerol kinase family protein [Ligilactobacillus]|uniref:Diacylglycerol kinase n=2 Tax=Ligilactobacillus aviarius TaxID=1606 RepID=A0A510WQD4_9LACO|nr:MULTISPECIES: diacylglycerol kinase family protein [Ligilactobacillus]MDO3392562.1 diacylglycerol kinase family protein [Ligilactobacillus sp. 110_WCHN]GEK41414.1 diacylglycerol kinase [Ligilactobacillus aviarius]
MVMDFKDKFATSWKNRKFSHSLRHACDGLITLFKEERNFRFELICLSLVVIAGLIFHLPISEWLWLIAASAIVLIAEAANTAIENLTDLASHLHSNDFAKKAKDIAAGMVLLAAAFAVIVAGLIFIPRIIALF